MNNKSNIVLKGKKSINNFPNKKIVKNNLNEIQTEISQNDDKRQVIINH